MTHRSTVIVIGAGLGGLSVATMLARNGVQTLLLERHNVPGGYATSFVRGRYEFEVALHELSGIGPPERRGSLYRYLGQQIGNGYASVKSRHLFRDIVDADLGTVFILIECILSGLEHDFNPISRIVAFSLHHLGKAG